MTYFLCSPSACEHSARASEHNSLCALLTPYNQHVLPACHGAFRTPHHRASLPAPRGVCVSLSTGVQHGPAFPSFSDTTILRVTLQRGSRRAETSSGGKIFTVNRENRSVSKSCSHITVGPAYISYLWPSDMMLEPEVFVTGKTIGQWNEARSGTLFG